ncbi:MAG TPA: GNAT family N-acetyltransferase, partial [Stellaceae bacterium]|nr:GNAT family N-acetyltransferase [Stellaceae bacterium]
ALLEDTVTYLEMFGKPASRPLAAPFEKLALMRAERATVSFYRYIYNAVGLPWLWFERRLIEDDELAEIIRRPALEIFVLYVRGVPAGFFELDSAAARETKLCYFGLVPEFIGRRLGPFLLQAAIDRAFSRPIERLWLHTSRFDHPKALATYQRAGFIVYDRRRIVFEDPRLTGDLPRSLRHPLLPPLD